MSESHRHRVGDPVPRSSPFFDGTTITLVAARGETLAFQLLHRNAGSAALRIAGPGIITRSYELAPAIVARPSTAMYGRSLGRGAYPDLLQYPSHSIFENWWRPLNEPGSRPKSRM